MAKIKSKKPTSRKGLPPSIEEASTNLSPIVKTEEVVKIKDLSFKVPISFHTEMKSYAASRGLSMVNLLKVMFDDYKNNNS